jgi:hypothetical protein
MAKANAGFFVSLRMTVLFEVEGRTCNGRGGFFSQFWVFEDGGLWSRCGGYVVDWWRLRKAATLLRFPQVAMLHQRRWWERVRS